VLEAEELDRIEIRTAASRATLTGDEGVAPLPRGAALAPTGVFTWQLGAGVLGVFDLVFDEPSGLRYVRIMVHPQGSGRVGPQIVIDSPTGAETVAKSFIVAGWAADLDSDSGAGVEAVHVWVYPVDGSSPIFLGAAVTGGHRPDVAAYYGDRFGNTGYGLRATVAQGDYVLAVFALSSTTGDFLPAITRSISVR
jgi:hypothetical protein